jgi:hypothetical protein
MDCTLVCSRRILGLAIAARPKVMTLVLKNHTENRDVA